MKAIQFNFSIPRYVIGKAAEKVYPPLLWSGLSCTGYKEVPEPELPGPEWVKIQTHLGGICGTDMSTLYLHTSTYYEPFSSFPFILGHENVGTIVEVGAAVQGWQVGDRVTVEPTLWCAPRGFVPAEWCDYCKNGQPNRCTHTTQGALRAGFAIGSCADTGGSWSPRFTAHHSQLYRVPDNVSDENALLVEPFSVGLHAALLGLPEERETVLILGAGTIGLMQLAALRALGCKARILITARYAFQAEAASRLGASEVLQDGALFSQVSALTGGKLFQPKIGKQVFLGGVNTTYECLGSSSALDDALRLTSPGGQVVLVGVPGLTNGVDLSAAFIQELTVKASYIYDHAESWRGRKTRTYELALELMQSGAVDLGWMVTHRYPLEDYAMAFKQVANKKKFPVIKPVFEFPGA